MPSSTRASLRRLHQAGPQRVAFDVTQHGQEVIVLRDRERLEAILINMAAAGAVVVGMPADGVRQGEPTQERTQLPLGFRPEDDVPVRGHQAVAQDAKGASFQGLVEYAQESGVVGGFAKQLQPGGRAVQGVVDVTCRCLRAERGMAGGYQDGSGPSR